MPGDNHPATISLATTMDGSFAADLLSELKNARGRALVIAADRVVRPSTLGIQVLLSAAVTWRMDGQPFVITATSTPFAEAIETLGLSPDHLPVEAVAP